MIGFPHILNTKEDWYNAVNYAKNHGEYKTTVKAGLENLKSNIYMKVLKPEAEGKDPEEQTADDYMDVLNPACDKIKLGFTDEEIDILISEVSK